MRIPGMYCGVALVCVLMLLMSAGCTTDQQQGGVSPPLSSEEGTNAPVSDTEAPVTMVSPTPEGVLSPEETADLLFMQEEERLARDVYAVFYETWNMQVFENIGDAEQSHTDSVAVLVRRYGLDDDSAEVVAGVFTNPELQKLYDDLVLAGMQSPEDALRAAALVEETDIVDLQDAMSRTENADILRVYENLMAGSENHLRSFVKNLEQRGASYTPVVLTQEEYDAIISASGSPGGAP